VYEQLENGTRANDRWRCSTDGETSDLTRGRVKKEHASRYSHDVGPAHHTVSRKTHKDSVETADNRGTYR